MVSLRTVLRSIEDESYREKGNEPSSKAVITFRAEDNELSKEEWSKLEILKAFNSAIRTFIDFVDKMVAVRDIDLTKLTIKIERQLNTEGEIIEYVTTRANEIVENGIRKVAVDTKLTNPKKIEKFAGLSNFSRKASLSYFALRRCIEHHKNIPQSISLFYLDKRDQIVKEVVEIVKRLYAPNLPFRAREPWILDC